MRTHTQLKIFFAGLLIAVAMLATVNAPAQGTGAGQSKRPAVVALPLDAHAHVVLAPPMPQGSSVSFLPAVSYGSGGFAASSVAVADFNGDGDADIVTVNCALTGYGGYICGTGDGVIGVLLGNGDGTFQPVLTYDSGGEQDLSIAVADVNGDGMPDLAVAHGCGDGCGIGTVSVLVGK